MTALRVFGGFARGDERPESDLDLLVHLPDEVGLFEIGRFTQELEELLEVPVDVVPDDSPEDRVQVDVERVLVSS